MTATTPAMASASCWSCVTYTVVTPSVSWRRLSSKHISARSFASMLDSGSSSSSSGGSVMSARPNARRCCCPPERSVAGRVPSPSSRTSSSMRSTRFRISVRSGRRLRGTTVSGKATLSWTDMCGQIAYDWKTMPSPRAFAGTWAPDRAESRVRPPTTISPLSGVSRPAMQRRIVVFPQPDGPSRAKNSPRRTENVTPSAATTVRASSPLPAANVFVRSSMRSSASLIAAGYRASRRRERPRRRVHRARRTSSLREPRAR